MYFFWKKINKFQIQISLIGKFLDSLVYTLLFKYANPLFVILTPVFVKLIEITRCECHNIEQGIVLRLIELHLEQVGTKTTYKTR